ncbi:hypothetical protein D9756_006234 [Leucocoprinus leucothites]|uniref:F-box domain-containing protein n=1 Tax=Leucocoprinus leucothites TaxID=201217 RepID=A0A8H5D2Z7_9AGAR|nr:hypothetical protein D9756_006234 [Leucoagaricus leucothites]
MLLWEAGRAGLASGQTDTNITDATEPGNLKSIPAFPVMLWLISSSITYLRNWYLGLTSPSPQLLDLPHEILFNICLHLDYQALTNTTQTCKKLRDITSSQYFWKTLCAILESRPGFQQPLFEPDQKKSFDDLQRYTRNMLRIHDGWLGPSSPQFRTRQVKSRFSWDSYELLPGGRWLFGVLTDGRACILDLDAERPVNHVLLATFHPQDLTLSEFNILIKEDNHSSFLVALYKKECWDNESTRICIYQVEQQIEPKIRFRATSLAVIWDCPRGHIRSCVELSERYIIQCCSLLNTDSDHTPVILQLRRYSKDPAVSEKYIEKQLADEGSAKAFLLPNDRLGVITWFSVEIYSIHETSNTAMPDLVLLHRIPADYNPSFSSRPFIGKNGIHLVGVYQDVVSRVVIDHDFAVPPIIKSIGSLKFKPSYSRSHTKFGPLVSVYFQGQNEIDIATYDLSSACFLNFRRSRLNLSDCCNGGQVVTLAGLDDNRGRIVLKLNGGLNFLVMDLI